MVYAPLIWNGMAVGGACDNSLPKDVIRAPWDGQVVGTIPEAGPAELDAALDAATTAYRFTRRTSPAERANWLRAIADVLDGSQTELVELLVAEIAKPIRLARQEVARAVLTFRLAADAVDAYDWQSELALGVDARAAAHRVTARARPIGPVLAFVPYNWPINLLAHKLAAILATGNTAVVKLSPLAPLASAELVRLVHVAGVPDGVVNSWNGPNAVAQTAVTSDRIAAVSFTGSGRVGWMLRELAPRKPFVLELGGNTTAILGPDRAPSGALADSLPTLVESAYAFAGQVCISTQNLFVPEEQLGAYGEMISAQVAKISVGDPNDPETRLSAMIRESAAAQVAARFETLPAHQCPTGVRRNGNRLEPVLTVGLPPDHATVTEEQFGPVLHVIGYRDEAALIASLQRFRYRLQAAIYSDDDAFAHRLIDEIPMGGWTRGVPPSTRFDAMPYGGERDSGIAREGGAYGFAPFLRWESIVERR
ncbi:MAG: aldehyde dehydrogenase family protein [Fimbriimonadaceae bacterium]|nr:aldehyde dehydrogenase family protein [Fimbriimonadaceae bacterium]